MPTASPISRITELIDWSTRHQVADQRGQPERRQHGGHPSSSGIPAATSAPKATSRITSVTGSDVISARWKSEAAH